MEKVGLVGLFLFAMLGCSTTHTYVLSCGDGGTAHVGDFGIACSYVVVVTGFECPEHFPVQAEFEGGFVCSQQPFDPGKLPDKICVALSNKCTPVMPPDGGMPPADGGVGGCQTADDCESDEYCDGTCEEASGECMAIPTEATCTEAEEPFCTCDGTPKINNNGCIWERHTPGDQSCFSP